MGEKNGAGREKPKAIRKKAKKAIGVPDTAILARYSPTDSADAHPDWIKKKFPGYIAAHAGHDSKAIREFAHGGHLIKIITTYRVEVDGKPIRAHLSVDEDGRVYSHATPFVTYGSAVDLMKSIIDSYSDAFSGAGDDGDDGSDHNHGGHQ